MCQVLYCCFCVFWAGYLWFCDILEDYPVPEYDRESALRAIRNDNTFKMTKGDYTKRERANTSIDMIAILKTRRQCIIQELHEIDDQLIGAGELKKRSIPKRVK